MEAPTLRIPVDKPAESDPYNKYTVAYSFTVLPDGLRIKEEWSGYDEGYGDYEAVTIPWHVWMKALPWLVENAPLAMGGIQITAAR